MPPFFMMQSNLRRIGFTLGVLLALSVCTLALTAAATLNRTRPKHIVRVGLMGRPAADSLGVWWGRDEPSGIERGFCVTNYDVIGYHDPHLTDTLVIVNTVERAKMLMADQTHARFRCEPDNAPTVHTHPKIEGIANCSPSRPDYKTVWGKGFGVVQCDSGAWEFYWPSPDERW